MAVGAMTAAAAGWGGSAAQAAEASGSADNVRTRVVIRLRSHEAVEVRSRWEASPPTIVLEFPEGRVNAALPERVAIRRGVIEAMEAVSDGRTGRQAPTIRTLSIRLRGRYDYAVRQEPGQILVEIAHPSTVAQGAFEITLANGVIVTEPLAGQRNERFAAMQRALMDMAHPSGASFQPSAALASGQPAPSVLGATGRSAAGATTARSSAPGRSAPRSRASAPSPRQAPSIPSGWWVAILALAAGGVWSLSRRSRIRLSRSGSADRQASGSWVIDELIARTFSHRGFQPLQVIEQPAPMGPVRLMMKDGKSSAVQYIGEGAFFEKRSVERFVQRLRALGVEQGCLVAPGSFTVPAQRFAGEHGVTLIGRDQLLALLRDATTREPDTQRLADAERQLNDLQHAFEQNRQEMEELRQQRNESSWYLGEERATTASREARLGEVNAQLAQWQAQAEQAQQAAEQMRRQWEESQWYLGEARAYAQHLEAQLGPVRDTCSRLEEAHRDTCATLQELQAHRTDLQEQLAQAQREAALTRRELEALRQFGERRQAPRVTLPEVRVRLTTDDDAELFCGSAENFSLGGFGIAQAPRADWPERIHCHLALPQEERPLTLTGRVIWQAPEPDGSTMRAGGAFERLPDDARERLQQLLATAP